MVLLLCNFVFCHNLQYPQINFQIPQIGLLVSVKLAFCYLWNFITKNLPTLAKCRWILPTWNMTPLLKLTFMYIGWWWWWRPLQLAVSIAATAAVAIAVTIPAAIATTIAFVVAAAAALLPMLLSSSPLLPPSLTSSLSLLLLLLLLLLPPPLPPLPNCP